MHVVCKESDQECNLVVAFIMFIMFALSIVGFTRFRVVFGMCKVRFVRCFSNVCQVFMSVWYILLGFVKFLNMIKYNFGNSNDLVISSRGKCLGGLQITINWGCSLLMCPFTKLVLGENFGVGELPLIGGFNNKTFALGIT